MSHSHELAPQLQPRINRIKGQLNALEKALAEQKSCLAVLQQAAAIRGAVNGLLHTILEQHIRHHFSNAVDNEQQTSTEELLKILQTYLK